MKYRQITSGERYAIAALRKQRLSIRAIAAELQRSPSTISRELRRNLSSQARYTPSKADSYAVARRRRSRRNSQFSIDEWVLVEHLRQATKKRRKRNGSRDSRGRLAGKRHISERPPEVETRQVVGHWEGDTIMGDDPGKHSALTLVERKTGYLQMGKLVRHCAGEANAKTIELIERQPERFKSITADNGTEFHSYKNTEEATGVPFYFATPHHSWERGTNENTNGLIRQYLPKRTSMAHLTQDDLDAIAHKLNTRPRKLLGFMTPKECYELPATA